MGNEERGMRKGERGRRRAFTMIELLVAATLTAMIAAAGATFVSAMSNASLTTRDVRGATAAGHYALTQIERTIREARSVGQVTSTTVTLWLDDSNNNDKVDLYETGVIRYDGSGRRIVHEYLQSANGTTPTTTISTGVLTSYTSLSSQMPAGDKRSIVWCSEVDSLAFTGNPSNTDTRMVEVVFTLGNNGQPMTFRGSASPRAAADYLFYNETQTTPPPGSTRKARKTYSRWTGFTDLGSLSDALLSG